MNLQIDRRQFAACGAATALTTILHGKAWAQPPQWSDNKVDVSGHNPQTEGGPTAASGGPALLSVYLGEGGRNLWYSYAPPSLIWQGNQAIRDPQSREIITSSGGRPGLCYVSAQGYFLMVVPGQRVFDTWKYPFGDWTLVNHHEDITELQFSEPALGDGGDRTHLLVCDNLGNLWWYSMDHTGGGWVNQQRVASGRSPSITSIADTLHALYWDTDQKAFVKLTLPHGSPSWQSHRVFPQGGTPNQGASIASLNTQLFVVYTTNGNELQCATLNKDFSLSLPRPLTTKGRAAATEAAPALTAFQNSLVVLHQGESSKNLWFAVRNS